MRILGELEVIDLGDDSHARADIIPLNGVVAQMHNLDIGNVFLDERLHRADSQIDCVDDAQRLLFAHVPYAPSNLTRGTAASGATFRTVSRMMQNAIT